MILCMVLILSDFLCLIPRIVTLRAFLLKYLFCGLSPFSLAMYRYGIPAKNSTPTYRGHCRKKRKKNQHCRALLFQALLKLGKRGKKINICSIKAVISHTYCVPRKIKRSSNFSRLLFSKKEEKLE